MMVPFLSRRRHTGPHARARRIRRASRRARRDGRRARPGRPGQPRVLWLGGPAGIGKTSLIRRLLGGPARRLRAAGRGEEREVGLPFGVLAQLVADVPTALGPLLAGGPPPDADPLAVGAELLTVLGGCRPPARWSSWSTTPSGSTTPSAAHSCSSGGGCAATRSSSWSRRATTRRPRIGVVGTGAHPGPPLHRRRARGLDAERDRRSCRGGRGPGPDPRGRPAPARPHRRPPAARHGAAHRAAARGARRHLPDPARAPLVRRARAGAGGQAVAGRRRTWWWRPRCSGGASALSDVVALARRPRSAGPRSTRRSGRGCSTRC